MPQRLITPGRSRIVHISIVLISKEHLDLRLAQRQSMCWHQWRALVIPAARCCSVGQTTSKAVQVKEGEKTHHPHSSRESESPVLLVSSTEQTFLSRQQSTWWQIYELKKEMLSGYLSLFFFVSFCLRIQLLLHPEASRCQSFLPSHHHVRI